MYRAATFETKREAKDTWAMLCSYTDIKPSDVHLAVARHEAESKNVAPPKRIRAIRKTAWARGSTCLAIDHGSVGARQRPANRGHRVVKACVLCGLQFFGAAHKRVQLVCEGAPGFELSGGSRRLAGCHFVAPGFVKQVFREREAAAMQFRTPGM